MDNYLGRTEGDGASFTVVLLVVFSQIDPVGAAAARQQK